MPTNYFVTLEHFSSDHCDNSIFIFSITKLNFTLSCHFTPKRLKCSVFVDSSLFCAAELCVAPLRVVSNVL